MAVRPIVVWPDPRLREKTRAIPEITDQIRALYRDLSDTMYAYDGVGIAAVQIGEPFKMFLVDARVAGRLEEGDPLAFINPEVIWVSPDKEKSEEG
jgi:peptide deformylase